VGNLTRYDKTEVFYEKSVKGIDMVIMTKSPSNLAERSWPLQGQWTYEDWLQLPDDGYRYEIIDGELYMTPLPAIAHQFSSNRLTTAMTNHVDRNSLGFVVTAPVGVQLPNQPVPFEPDIVFVSGARKEIIGEKYIEGVPDLLSKFSPQAIGLTTGRQSLKSTARPVCRNIGLWITEKRRLRCLFWMAGNMFCKKVF
jgi:hypothetical protein